MRILPADIETTLPERLASHHVPGVSIAAFHDGAWSEHAGGTANIVTGETIRSDTLMAIGSIAKVFTTTLVLQLVDEGRIDLDRPVAEYLPQLRLHDSAALDQITVRMLLNHTSGIDGELLPDHGHDEETIEKGIQRFAELPQLFSPGAQFSYCNAATVVAGYLAQQVRRRSWYTLVKERIFGPLEMRDAVALPEDAVLHRVAVGHYYGPAHSPRLYRTSQAYLPLSFAPSGTTLMMSPRALLQFALAHMRGGIGADGARILSERCTSLMQQPDVSNRGKGYTYTEGMGLGWMVSDRGLLHHAGGGPGIFSVLYACPRQNWAVAILTNAEHGLGLINELLELGLEKTGHLRPFGMTDFISPSTQPGTNCEPYVGLYEDIANRFRVAAAGTGLAISKQTKFAYYESISTKEGDPKPLVPVGKDLFVIGAEDLRRDKYVAALRLVAFRDPDSAGRMQYLGNSMRLYKRAA